ncbi:hypothetical protein MWU50_02330 [Flavobacteriaceae bacterium S0862]|nr:hypothetical protein [Flavobacteriaceae bacterium S0862]
MKINKFTLISIILLFYGCSPKISEHFESNKYVRKYNIHLVNESLQLYFKTPADITYTKNRDKLKEIIRNEDFQLKGKVLIYGIAKEPSYSYYITVSNSKKHNYPKHLVVLDTTQNNQTIRFIGKPIDDKWKINLESDLKSILFSLEIGPSFRKEISSVMEIVGKYGASNQFYSALNEINEFPAYDRNEELLKKQMALTFSSFLGENDYYQTYLTELESRFQPNEAITKIIQNKLESDSNALKTIINEAEQHRILMINENHFYPNHRLLVSDLLENLKEIGYDYLALEALEKNQDSLLNLENAYPTLKSGFYIKEQNFSNLIREAKALGYKFVAYENEDNNKDREVGQAENLYNKTFKINPNSKVIVLAGLDHILEKPTSRGKKWMATIFRNKYSIDPLTISQTHLNNYRKQIDSNYGIIKSNYFDNERLNSLDYLVLNNRDLNYVKSQATYSYKNSADHDVQVLLFYNNEIEKKYDYHKRAPYFSTILKAGKEYELPVNKHNEVYLYTLDHSGKKIDEKTITPANNGYK